MEQSYLLEKGLADYVVQITGVDYYGKLELKDIENMVKDLVNEYHKLEERLEEQEEHCKEFHTEKKFDKYDYYGVSKEDFI